MSQSKYPSDSEHARLFANEEECAIAFSVLNNAAVAAQYLSDLNPQNFAEPLAKTVLTATLHLLDTKGIATPLLVASYLEETGQLSAVGGHGPFLIKCQDAQMNCPISCTSTLYERVKAAATRRRAYQAGTQLTTEACGNKSIGELLEMAETLGEEIREMGSSQSRRRGPMVEFLTPAQILDLPVPEDSLLVGDRHIQRGTAFVIAGHPGVGKSRALTALAYAGATGTPFFGMPVYRRFRTMILQCENGTARLRSEYAVLRDPALSEYILVSPPPPWGFAFDDPRFLRELRESIEKFRPAVFALDPWNRLALDDRMREYREAFEAIKSVLPTGDDEPAVGICAHTRKPGPNEKLSGRGLLASLAGSYILGSIARSVFVLQAASDDSVDNRRVWTCCKNNDGPEGERSAWELRDGGLFAPVADFDWQEFDDRYEKDAKGITEAHVREAFHDGNRELSRSELVLELMTLSGAKRTTCYKAIEKGGKLAPFIQEIDGGMLKWAA
jgi:hypothetical protein